MTISRWILLRIRNFQIKVVEKIEIHILCSVTFLRKSYHLRDNVKKYDWAREARYDNIIRCMRFACCITRLQYTHKICNTYCFSRQKWLRKRDPVLRYTTLPILFFLLPFYFFAFSFLFFLLIFCFYFLSSFFTSSFLSYSLPNFFRRFYTHFSLLSLRYQYILTGSETSKTL
jgi:hypothetical protein